MCGGPGAVRDRGSSLARLTEARHVFSMSTRELIEKELAAMPELLQREVYDFARFWRHKNEGDTFNGLLLSEAEFTKDWNTPEEDAAWASL